jgi:flagellar biosynthesis protein FlhA
MFKLLASGATIPIAVILMLLMMILPLPTFILDILFTFNISLSLIVLLSGIYVSRPLEFTVFPTILLLATLLRLALNIASTRVVLLNGHAGSDSAGQVIESFGEVVIGGNYAVGIVVFVILVIINFVVVTKGAGRISEVSARFTLDSMPGKQMAIDADLNAGLINQEEAKRRRIDVAQEADFYGSMDGASKFVRGDAIAGILILLINLIGGIFIGTLQHQLPLSHAVQTYALLTIGDGLVAQIPGLLLSIAAAIMVTRVSTAQDMGQAVKTQLFAQPKSLIFSGAILVIIGLIPGMPHLAFLSLGLLIVWLGYYLKTTADKLLNSEVLDSTEKSNPISNSNNQTSNTQSEKTPNEATQKDLDWEDVKLVEPVTIELGLKLIDMVEQGSNSVLFNRIKAIRKKLSESLGFLIPIVHIKDNLSLAQNHYRILVQGVVVGSSDIMLNKNLAINPGQIFGNIEGIETKEPTFGLPAKWIDKNQSDRAQSLGYTVVDAPTIMATHLSHALQNNAYQLFGHDEAQKWLQQLSKTSPKLTEELIPNTLSLSILVKILQNLLMEQVPIRDARSIAQSLATQTIKSQDPGVLTEVVRSAIGRMIVQEIYGTRPELAVIGLDPNLEQILQQNLQASGGEGMSLEPSISDKIQKTILDFVKKQESRGEPAVLLVSAGLRRFFSKFTRLMDVSLPVISFNEIPEGKQIKMIASLGNT